MSTIIFHLINQLQFLQQNESQVWTATTAEIVAYVKNNQTKEQELVLVKDLMGYLNKQQEQDHDHTSCDCHHDGEHECDCECEDDHECDGSCNHHHE